MRDQTTEAETDWINPADAAAMLGVSTKTLTRLASDGDIRARRLPSGHRRYLRSSVEDLADSEDAAS
jgi:putative resolvase